MPSRLIQYHQGMSPRRDSLADFLKVKRHGLGIGKWQHQTDSGVPLRAHGTKDVGRFGLLLPYDSRPCSFARPNSRLRTALANAHFILEPHIDLMELDLSRQTGLYLADQVFF